MMGELDVVDTQIDGVFATEIAEGWRVRSEAVGNKQKRKQFAATTLTFEFPQLHFSTYHLAYIYIYQPHHPTQRLRSQPAHKRDTVIYIFVTLSTTTSQ